MQAGQTLNARSRRKNSAAAGLRTEQLDQEQFVKDQYQNWDKNINNLLDMNLLGGEAVQAIRQETLKQKMVATPVTEDTNSVPSTFNRRHFSTADCRSEQGSRSKRPVGFMSRNTAANTGTTTQKHINMDTPFAPSSQELSEMKDEQMRIATKYDIILQKQLALGGESSKQNRSQSVKHSRGMRTNFGSLVSPPLDERHTIETKRRANLKRQLLTKIIRQQEREEQQSPSKARQWRHLGDDEIVGRTLEDCAEAYTKSKKAVADESRSKLKQFRSEPKQRGRDDRVVKVSEIVRECVLRSLEPDESSAVIESRKVSTKLVEHIDDQNIKEDEISFSDYEPDELSIKERKMLGKRNMELKNYLLKYPNVCVTPKEGHVSEVHPVQPFVILESESLRPPIRRHPEFLQNKTWLEYTTHVNHVVTRHLGAKVILSRSLLQKRNDYERVKSESKWQNPYEALIGEPQKQHERQFVNEEYYRTLKVKRSKGKSFIQWHTDGARRVKNRAEAKQEIRRKEQEDKEKERERQISEMHKQQGKVTKKEQKSLQAKKIRDEERMRRQRLEAMTFQANDYKAITDKFANYRKHNPENPYTNEFSPKKIEDKQQELTELVQRENQKFSQQNDLLSKFRRDFKQVCNERTENLVLRCMGKHSPEFNLKRELTKIEPREDREKGKNQW